MSAQRTFQRTSLWTFFQWTRFTGRRLRTLFTYSIVVYASAILPVISSIEVPEMDIFSKSDKEIEYRLEGGTTPSDQLLRSKSLKQQHNFEVNVSRLLNQLIESHDRRIRPNYGGPPVEVNVTAHITTISAISEVSMDYTLDLYLRQMWRDPRLVFQSNDQSSLTIGIDMVNSIWTPDTFFPNEKKSFFHEATSHNSFLRIDNQGNVLRSIRLTVTANCPMNLHTFPLDVQVCALEIESYGYSTKDIIYHWHQGLTSVTIDENVHLAHFTIGDHSHVERTISLSTGDYSRLSTYFTFKRNIGFYLIQIYFPSSLIVVISWVSFWLNRDATQARVAIGVTTVLTMTTLMTSTNASLPKVSYVKSLDIFLGVCFFIVFASLLEYAAIGYLMKRYRSCLASHSTPTCYYELEEQPQLRKALDGRNRVKRKKRDSVLQVNSYAEQSMPLLSNSHAGAKFGVRPVVISNSPEVRLPVYLRIRPSHVDLLSRIVFPSFFALFHLVYWSIYLYL